VIGGWTGTGGSWHVWHADKLAAAPRSPVAVNDHARAPLERRPHPSMWVIVPGRALRAFAPHPNTVRAGASPARDYECSLERIF
jgi:hypothetical protein